MTTLSCGRFKHLQTCNTLAQWQFMAVQFPFLHHDMMDPTTSLQMLSPVRLRTIHPMLMQGGTMWSPRTLKRLIDAGDRWRD